MNPLSYVLSYLYISSLLYFTYITCLIISEVDAYLVCIDKITTTTKINIFAKIQILGRLLPGLES